MSPDICPGYDITFDSIPDIEVNIVPDIIPDIMPKLHDVVTKQPDILHDIVYPILVTTFLTGAKSGFWTRYRVKHKPISGLIFQIYPFLTGAI